MKIGWSTDFIVVHGDGPAAAALDRVQQSNAEWVIVERAGGQLRYVFSRRELLAHPHVRKLAERGTDFTAIALCAALDLHEGAVSRQVSDSGAVRPRAPDSERPSAARYVEIDGGKPVAVGGADVARSTRTRALPPRAGRPPQPLAVGAEPKAAAPPAEDEGTTPIRFPSIEPVGAVAAGAPIELVVDLRREEAPQTVGGIALPTQPADWKSIELAVTLQSPQIDFDAGGTSTVTVRRNDASLAARIRGRVNADLAPGAEIEVKARFCLGTRFCGSALRRLEVGGRGTDAGASAGAVQVDFDAEPPDLTVFITVFDRSAPGRLHWRIVTRPFDALPPKLDGIVDLGRDPAAEAAALFRQFANLERGSHRESIEGFGEELWRRTPPEFQAGYWALHDHYRRPLTIQFVSDDPHLPWELMSPFRAGESHGTLALRHAVARWIGHWQGFMRNRLPRGQLVAISPHYRSASAQLSLAEATTEKLVSAFDAQRLPGTRAKLLELLEQPPAESIALLFFNGHGAFDADAATASVIKLEDANLAAREVARQKVQLGERYGTLVFFNACEVGATASVLGTVGGWADAFLSRKFRAFIAPLWAIDEEDAQQATQELLTAIVNERAPIGAALRDLRRKYGEVSPTFYSYLLYGDVTARIAAE